MQISPSKSSIFYKRSSTFAAIMPTKNSLTVEFYSDREIKSPVIKNFLKVSKNRIAHSVKVSSKKDIYKQLILWLKGSFILTGGK
jgi:hypothetical protein